MKKKDVLRYFKNGRVFVARETYSIVRSSRPCAGAFAVVCDDREITCVIDESLLKERKDSDVNVGWKRITFDMILPFELVGFMAYVSNALAKNGISIFNISSYSTDHIFVKYYDLEKAIETLKQLGLSVQVK